LAADGRGEVALAEHQEIVDAIMHGHEDKADDCLRQHISIAFSTRLKLLAESD
jgi:DNA-binding GntR family transcriptional regulator